MSELNGMMHFVMWEQSMEIDDCSIIETPSYDDEMDAAEERYFNS